MFSESSPCQAEWLWIFQSLVSSRFRFLIDIYIYTRINIYIYITIYYINDNNYYYTIIYTK